MLLLDSLYINNGGGKVLLDYLVLKLEETGVDVYYLFDERCINDFAEIPVTRKSYLKATLLNRYRFFKKHKTSFNVVFCFGNLAPPIKLSARVFTYFHQPMYLKIPKDFKLIHKVKFWIKTRILYSIKNNTDYWLAQSDIIKAGLVQKYKLNVDKVLVMPFYPPFEKIDKLPIRKKFSYLYVSNAPSHKNHVRLIEAFCKFYDKKQVGELILTIGPQFENIITLISEKISKEYPIVNVGFVNRFKLHKLYLSSEYLIFPSLAESFGLGLVEAIENGCKVIGSDLPYMYEVCKPSITFNPLVSKSIENAFEKSLGDNIPLSKQIITNKINELIVLLK